MCSILTRKQRLRFEADVPTRKRVCGLENVRQTRAAFCFAETRRASSSRDPIVPDKSLCSQCCLGLWTCANTESALAHPAKFLAVLRERTTSHEVPQI